MHAPEIDKIIHTRFARLFLDHRTELQLADKSDAEIVELSGATFLALMAAVVVGKRNNDQALLDRLAWFTAACEAEIDETPRARLDG
jgi:hypothetical protein